MSAGNCVYNYWNLSLCCAALFFYSKLNRLTAAKELSGEACQTRGVSCDWTSAGLEKSVVGGGRSDLFLSTSSLRLKEQMRFWIIHSTESLWSPATVATAGYRKRFMGMFFFLLKCLIMKLIKAFISQSCPWKFEYVRSVGVRTV